MTENRVCQPAEGEGLMWKKTAKYFKNSQHKIRWRTPRRPLRFAIFCVICMVLTVAVIGSIISAVTGRRENQSSEQSAAVETAEPIRALNLPPAAEINDMVQIAREAQSGAEKVCYLTFDDGPTQAVTPSVLDTLKQYDVKATFFMLGKMIEADMALAKRVYDEGHLLANHSYSHNYQTLYASGESFMGEIQKTEELIEQVTGQKPFKLMRFPGGGYNAGDHAAEKQTYKELLRQNGYYYADWNALNGDAEGGNRTAAQLLAKIQATATQDRIVVLMHDAAAKKSTAEALPSVIEYLKSQGYAFRRLDEVEYYENGAQSNPYQSLIM